MDNRSKAMLENAINGGSGSGREILFEIQHRLRMRNTNNSNHELLPNEFITYLADSLLSILHDPGKSDKILKIEKPRHKTRNINLTRDGTVAYMCLNAKINSPKKSYDKIYGEIAVELSDDYKWLFPRSDDKDVSKKTVERIYKKTFPIIRRFKYLDGFKLFSTIQKGASFNGWPKELSGTDNELYHGLLDEIDDFNYYLLVLNEMPQMDEKKYYEIIDQITRYLKHYDEYEQL